MKIDLYTWQKYLIVFRVHDFLYINVVLVVNKSGGIFYEKNINSFN